MKAEQISSINHRHTLKMLKVQNQRFYFLKSNTEMVFFSVYSCLGLPEIMVANLFNYPSCWSDNLQRPSMCNQGLKITLCVFTSVHSTPIGSRQERSIDRKEDWSYRGEEAGIWPGMQDSGTKISLMICTYSSKIWKDFALWHFIFFLVSHFSTSVLKCDFISKIF